MYVERNYNLNKLSTLTIGIFFQIFVLNIETKIFYQYKKTNIVYFLFHIKSEFTNLVNDLDIDQLSQFKYIFL